MLITIYDMDRTLTRGGTWVPWLRFWLRREAPWRVLLLPLLGIAGLCYALRLFDRGGLKAAAHRLVMGRRVARARVAAAAAAYADHVVAHAVFPAALAQIAADRAAGRRLVVATASNAYYAAAIAARFGIADVIATPSRWQGDWLDWRLGGPNCYGQAKARAVTDWLAAAGAAEAVVDAWSDHVSDRPLLELAAVSGGCAVAANPSPALRTLAAARGWRVADWGVPAKSFFERA